MRQCSCNLRTERAPPKRFYNIRSGSTGNQGHTFQETTGGLFPVELLCSIKLRPCFVPQSVSLYSNELLTG